MKKSIAELRGMTDAIKKALRGRGITDSDQLLTAASTEAQRYALARACSCRPATIRAIVHSADMARVKGVGGVYADLLKKAGVNSVMELRRCEPQDLYSALMEVNERYQYARQVPTLGMIAKWIDQARELPTIIED